ncbi:SDR family oxidoreductase [Spirosoma endophyticum]|uniref:Uncharacterized conserved protein YbjT, contains NAD(P)-binding and DUF2867 domains n=1 Tax=Spirosoma endophyticum TaxID=662367 RepID=A0A1I1N9B0_9BACT|nr:NAD(P)H-binding protein [Spirosoma endophyticum]SFC91353.1 Uncharacterized conserved protein YbjT, contains NAD(P)-binding and DUF2867 domains [Spirosoma endophyticum]
MKIAVIGATGMIGLPVTQEFIKAGFSVRIIARDVEKVRKRFPDAEVIAGDITDVSSLISGLRGMDAVYLSLATRQDEKETDFHTESQGITNVIQAAKETRVRRIGYLSSIVMRYQGMNGYNWWTFEVKQEGVRILKASGIPYSIFYPSSFMEAMNDRQRSGTSIRVVGKSNIRQWYVSARDYGKQVARAFEIAKDGQNQEYVIQGPEAVTPYQAAERFVAAHKKEKLKVASIPSYVMRLGGLFSPPMKYGWYITEALNNYPEVFEAEKTWADLGKPEITLEKFAQQ